MTRAVEEGIQRSHAVDSEFAKRIQALVADKNRCVKGVVVIPSVEEILNELN